MRNKRKFLQTDFIKFILEKYSKDGQELPEEDETEMPMDDDGPQLKAKKKLRKMNELEDDDMIEDDEVDVEVDDEIIDELLNEYKRLKKKYESNRFRNRRK